MLVPDRLLLSELALAGEFAQVERVLWHRRFAGLARLDRQRRAFWPEGRAPRYARLPWWLTHAGLVAWERALLGRAGDRRAGARLALELLAAGARLRVVRRLQHAPAAARAAARGPRAGRAAALPAAARGGAGAPPPGAGGHARSAGPPARGGLKSAR